MVNMPINVSAYPSDGLDLVTDINQNINQEYYEWLLKQHNYFPDCAFYKEKFEDTIKMEHSYTRDYKQSTNSTIMATRTILVQRPPLCPSCHQLPPNHDEKVDTPEPYNIPIPPYNEEAGRRLLNLTEDMIKSCHNHNSDSEDWTQKLPKHNWTEQQLDLFNRVERILDMDQLGRLAIAYLPNECLRRNAIIEKSVDRMRGAFASVHWESRLTSWIHGLLIAYLPPKYMISYIEILQTLKRKIPTLVDRILYQKPVDMQKEYMSAIMKKSCDLSVITKTRTLPNNPVIVVVFSTISSTNPSSREKRWFELLSTLSSVETVSISPTSNNPYKSIEQETEHLVGRTRKQIQEIRNQSPNRHVILAGFGAGAAIALQVAIVEPVNSIVCLSFAFNTLNGVRGCSDDRILEITTPIIFIIGQNAQRSSQEEIESLRLKMPAHTLLVLVGLSDDALRVKRLNRLMEGVSQSMIDSMILDEIQEFATNCILNPPGPRKLKHINGCRKVQKQRAKPIENGPITKKIRLNGQQKYKIKAQPKINYVTNGITKQQNGHFDETSQHMIIENEENANDETIYLNASNVSNIRQKVKYIPQNNKFLHLKPPPKNTQKIYVKQENGNQSYTLGLNNIGTPVLHNNLLSIKNNRHIIENASQNQIIQEISINNIDEEKEEDKSLNGIDIFDIPILFADNDGNIIDENETNNETENIVPDEASQTINSVASEETVNDVASEEIVGDIEIEDTVTDEPNKDIEQSSQDQIIEKPSKPQSRTFGKFVILNKHAVSQMKSLKTIPAGKLRKVTFTQGTNGRSFRTGNRLSSIDSRTPRITNVIRSHTPRLQNFTRLSTLVNYQQHTNGTSTSPKSGILIKRNHMKNIIIHKGNDVQSIESNNLKRSIAVTKNSFGNQQNDSEDDSIKSLIADLED